MVPKIEKDHQRFRQIVKGKIRKELRKYLVRSELIGKEGKHLISIPVPGVDMPHFRYGSNDGGGVASGDGNVGDYVGKPDQQGQGKNQGGTEPGRHMFEVDISLDELAEILGDELALPRIQPRGKKRITTIKDHYTGIRQVGPESL